MRNRYLDLLRSLAIVRVVVYHVTGHAALTLVFPAMSVMFALAGSLMAASLDRTGVPAVARRLRRLLPSLWVLAAVFVPAMLLAGLPFSPRVLLWLFPVSDPPANHWGGLALSPIWYLRDYLWFVLASPLVLGLFRRAPLPTLLAPYALLAAIEFGVLPDAPTVLREFGLYFGAWLLGFAHHDGLLRRLSGRVLVPTAVTLGAAGADRLPLAHAVRGGAHPAGRPGRLDTARPARPRVRVVLVFALVGVVALLVGGVEDLAARRTPELLPAPPRVPAPRRADAERTPLKGLIDVNPRGEGGGRRGVSGG